MMYFFLKVDKEWDVMVRTVNVISLEEGTSIEELPSSDWPVACLWDTFFMPIGIRVPVYCGYLPSLIRYVWLVLER